MAQITTVKGKDIQTALITIFRMFKKKKKKTQRRLDILHHNTEDRKGPKLNFQEWTLLCRLKREKGQIEDKPQKAA